VAAKYGYEIPALLITPVTPQPGTHLLTK